MSTIVVDDTQLPILKVRYGTGFSQEQWDDHVVKLMAIVQRGRPFALLTDTSRGDAPSARQRNSIVSNFQEHEAAWRQCVAGAIILTSAVTRGVLTAISWVKSPPFPTKAFATEDEAVAWLKSRLASHKG